MRPKFDLQLFAAGDNNDLPARSYQLEFKRLLQAVFKKQSYFADFFGGSIEAMDGIQENETAFYVKTSDIPCVCGTGYDKTATKAFGTGTGNSSRFGSRTEIIYTNTPAKYTWGWNFHEGIDRHTVNNDFAAAIADRLELQARAKTKAFNDAHGKFISQNAGHSETLLDYTDDNVLALFNALSKYYNNIEAVGTKRAKVCADLYNAIVDHRLTTTSKGSVANIDENGVVKFKGFLIEEVPDDLLQTGEVAYVYIDGVGKAFTGINTARTIESEDFDGVALQGAGKAGEFILPDNKKAVCKVLLDSEYGLDNLTVTSAASSTTSGKTKLTVSPALTSGNSYKYKVADNAVLPAAGQSVKGWTAWNGADEITAATGKEICVVECDSAYRAIKAGVATVTAKA
uniref:Major capsid protein n=1 Tax=Siphoviridae sp. ct5Px37 TaxID=2826293 RepID=A0A8S5N3I2_9CAUD|nr:MAG TPA: major capsid protein [Siphoviridae sp. ct5Px37]